MAKRVLLWRENIEVYRKEIKQWTNKRNGEENNKMKEFSEIRYKEENKGGNHMETRKERYFCSGENGKTTPLNNVTAKVNRKWMRRKILTPCLVS